MRIMENRSKIRRDQTLPETSSCALHPQRTAPSQELCVLLDVRLRERSLRRTPFGHLQLPAKIRVSLTATTLHIL